MCMTTLSQFRLFLFRPYRCGILDSNESLMISHITHTSMVVSLCNCVHTTIDHNKLNFCNIFIFKLFECKSQVHVPLRVGVRFVKPLEVDIILRLQI